MDIVAKRQRDQNQEIEGGNGGITGIDKDTGIDLTAYLQEINSLEPVTPEVDKLKVDEPFRVKSPLTVSCPQLESARVKPRMVDGSILLSLYSSPQTPLEDIFDPFAPAAEVFALAPSLRKSIHVTVPFSGHQLNFGSPEPEEESLKCLIPVSDDKYVHVEDNRRNQRSAAKVVDSEQHSGGEFDTPSPYFFKGDIDECCPRAPLLFKHSRNLIDVNPRVCRRLF